MKKENIIKYLEEYKKSLGKSKIETEKIDKLLKGIYTGVLQSSDEYTSRFVRKERESKLFETTLVALFDMTKEEIEKTYKIYFIDIMIKKLKQNKISKIIPISDDFSYFYIYSNEKIFEVSTDLYIDLNYELDEICKYYGVSNVTNEEYIEAQKIKDDFEKYENYESYIKYMF